MFKLPVWCRGRYILLSFIWNTVLLIFPFIENTTYNSWRMLNKKWLDVRASKFSSAGASGKVFSWKIISIMLVIRHVIVKKIRTLKYKFPEYHLPIAWMDFEWMHSWCVFLLRHLHHHMMNGCVFPSWIVLLSDIISS